MKKRIISLLLALALCLTFLPATAAAYERLTLDVTVCDDLQTPAATTTFTYGSMIVLRVIPRGDDAPDLSNFHPGSESFGRIVVYGGGELQWECSAPTDDMETHQGYFPAEIETQKLGIGTHSLSVHYFKPDGKFGAMIDLDVTVEPAEVNVWVKESYPTEVTYTGEELPDPTDLQLGMRIGRRELRNDRYATETEIALRAEIYKELQFLWNGEASARNPVDVGEYRLSVYMPESEKYQAVAPKDYGVIQIQRQERDIEVPLIIPYDSTETLKIDLREYLRGLPTGDAVYTATNLHIMSNASYDDYLTDGEIVLEGSVLTIPLDTGGVSEVREYMYVLGLSLKPLTFEIDMKNYFIRLTLRTAFDDGGTTTQPTAVNVSMDGWTYGETGGEPQCEIPEGVTPAITYQTALGAALSGKPTAAGDYKVTVAYTHEGVSYSGTAAFTIAKRPVKVSLRAYDKTYDGTTTASIAYRSAKIEGVLEGDSVGVRAAGTFADKNAGRDKEVTVDLVFTGKDGGSYCLSADTPATLTASINRKTISIRGNELNACSKPYDGTTETAVSEPTNWADRIEGLLSGEMLERDVDYKMAAYFQDAEIGENKPVTVRFWLTDSQRAQNYQLQGGTAYYEMGDTASITKGTGGDLPEEQVDLYYLDNGEKTYTLKFRGLPAGKDWTYGCAVYHKSNPDMTVSAELVDTTLRYSVSGGKAFDFALIHVTVENDQYEAFTQTVRIILWDKKIQEGLRFNGDVQAVSKTYGDAPFTITASGQVEGSTITYNSSNRGVATVDRNTGEVTIRGIGETQIWADASAVGEYGYTGIYYTLTVSLKTSGDDADKTISGTLPEGFFEPHDEGFRLTLQQGGTVCGVLAVREREFAFRNVTAGAYTISVSAEGYAPRTYSFTVGESGYSGLAVEVFRLGDVNGSGGDAREAVDISDMQCLYELLSTGSCQSGISDRDYQQAVADMNGDGKVDVYDLQRLYETVRDR